MLNNIIESLKIEETNMIEICETGGMEKSTILEEVKKKVWKESLLNMIKILSDIANPK